MLIAPNAPLGALFAIPATAPVTDDTAPDAILVALFTAPDAVVN